MKLFCLLTLSVIVAGAQAPTSEVTTKDAPLAFKSGVNLVPVTVVVRDSRGHAVGNLERGDFQLSDNGKPQMISRFTVERIVPAAAAPGATPGDKAAVGSAGASLDSDGIPDHFTAFLFDDLHLSQSDLVYTRDAARRRIDTGLQTLDRAAIYTTSGQQTQEFTSDRDKLHAALAAIGTGRASAEKSMQQNSCPQMGYYMADQLYNHDDRTAWIIAMQDVISCANLSAPEYPSCIQPTGGAATGAVTCLSVDLNNLDTAQRMVKTAARVVLLAGDRDTAQTLQALRAVVARMTSMPGQRSIVLVSPGFLVFDERHLEETGLIERAIKGSVVIGALDARGLYTQIPGGDASTRVASTQSIAVKTSYQRLEAMEQSDIMASLASGTGGAFYQGTNDYDEGFARTAAPPEYLYVLGFSPLDLKLDGNYHSLKIALTNVKGMTVEARKGYYAPAHSSDPADQARQQIEEEFFSRDEIHDLPAVLQTQYFKADNGDVRLSATAEVDVKKLAFHKDGARNRNDITVVTGLFDSDGNYVTGAQKIVEMRLLDETLEKRVDSGIAVKSSFAVHSGRYVVRMVVRDSEGQTMSAQSKLVEIP